MFFTKGLCGHLMQRTDSFEETLMLGKFEDGRRRENRGWGGWMASLTQWTWVWVNSRSWWWTRRPGVLWSMGSQSLTRVSNWTELKSCLTLCYPVDCSPPGSSVHRDSPGKNTGVGCRAFLQGISQPGDRTCVSYVSCIGRQVLYH